MPLDGWIGCVTWNCRLKSSAFEHSDTFCRCQHPRRNGKPRRLRRGSPAQLVNFFLFVLCPHAAILPLFFTLWTVYALIQLYNSSAFSQSDRETIMNHHRTHMKESSFDRSKASMNTHAFPGDNTPIVFIQPLSYRPTHSFRVVMPNRWKCVLIKSIK